jgi:hypothetical protein
MKAQFIFRSFNPYITQQDNLKRYLYGDLSQCLELKLSTPFRFHVYLRQKIKFIILRAISNGLQDNLRIDLHLTV